MKQKPQPILLCYICEAELTDKNKSKDHVPPKNLSVKSPDDIFYKAPCCKSCNNNFSHQESIFRDVMAVAGTFKGNISADTTYKTMKRNFQRSSLRHLLTATPSRDWTRIMESIKSQTVASTQGLHLGSRHVIQIPEELDIDALSIKIAKGLLHKHKKQIVPANFQQVGTYFIPDLPNVDMGGIEPPWQTISHYLLRVQLFLITLLYTKNSKEIKMRAAKCNSDSLVTAANYRIRLNYTKQLPDGW